MERGFREILIPTDQFGSATLNKLGVGTGAFSRQTIRLETPGFMYQEWMHGEERFLLKIDIEGMDVEILNHFPSDLFKRVDALSFEVDQRSLMFPAELMKLFDLLGEAGLTLNSNYGDSNPEEISSANLIDELSQRASYNSNVFFSRRD